MKEENSIPEENKNFKWQDDSSIHQTGMNYARSVLWSSELIRIKCDNTINQINALLKNWNSYFNTKQKYGEDLNEKYKIIDSKFDKGKSAVNNTRFIDDNSEIEVISNKESSEKESSEEEQIDQIVYKMTPDKAGQLLHDKQNIIIITGSELSSESNIPDLIEEYKTWKFNKKYTKDLKTLAATRYNKHYLKQKWDWWYKFIDLVKKNKPNNGHQAISDFQNYCKSIGKQCTIVTENIDSLQSKVVKSKLTSESNLSSESTTDSDDLLEINGNIMYMKCTQEWGAGLQLVSKRGPKPILKDQIPFWNNCGGGMRPHIRLINDDNKLFYNCKS